MTYDGDNAYCCRACSLVFGLDTAIRPRFCPVCGPVPDGVLEANRDTAEPCSRCGVPVLYSDRWLCPAGDCAAFFCGPCADAVELGAEGDGFFDCPTCLERSCGNIAS